MYLEKKEREGQSTGRSMTHEDVEEATAALKGLLGIGSSAPAKTSTPTTKASSNNSNNNNNKKKKKSPRRGVQSDKKNQNKNTDGSNSKSKRDKKKKKKQQAAAANAKERYAWSDFQCSPDASALPMPAFSSREVSHGKQNNANSNPEQNILTNGENSVDFVNRDLKNAPRAEDVEAKVIAEAQKAQEEQERQQLQDEIPQDDPVAANETGKQDIGQEGGGLVKEDPIQETYSQANEDLTVHSTGINLAALTAPPANSSPPSLSPTALPHMPTNTSSPPNALPLFTPPTNRFPPGGWSHLPQHQQPQMQQPQFLHHPPPGYITIQVQVPPVLLPGRRMVVHSPAGYPVQIVVPEGVPLGMVIPVNVPTGPIVGFHGGGGNFPPPNENNPNVTSPPPPPGHPGGFHMMYHHQHGPPPPPPPPLHHHHHHLHPQQRQEQQQQHP